MPRPRKTPEQVRESRQRAAHASLVARGFRLPEAPAPQPRPTVSEGDDSGLPGVCDYDSAVREQRITYHDAKAREQVIAEQLANEERREEAEIRRGKLYTRAQVQERDEAIIEAVLAALGAVIPDALATAGTAEDAEANRAKAPGIVKAVRKMAADTLRARGL